MNCVQCKLPIAEGEPRVEIESEQFHASQIQCSVALERERCATIAEEWNDGREYDDVSNAAQLIAAAIRNERPDAPPPSPE